MPLPQMLYKRNKAPSSRKKKDEGLDDCIVKALQLMQDEHQIVCLVSLPRLACRSSQTSFAANSRTCSAP
jgi:hypothetical protein